MTFSDKITSLAELSIEALLCASPPHISRSYRWGEL